MDIKSIDVAILCGGLGKRLRSVIGESPKVLAAVNEQPFLDIILNHLAVQGLKRVILLTGYMAQDVEKHYQNKRRDLAIIFSREKEALDTGGAIKNAHKMIQSNPFFALNGDSFCPVDFKSFLDFHYSKKSLASIVVAKTKNENDYGAITLNTSCRVMNFREKAVQPGPRYVNAGVYCFASEVFSHMPEAAKFSLELDFFPKFVAQPFYGFVINEKFMDIGTPQRLNEAKRLLRRSDDENSGKRK